MSDMVVTCAVAEKPSLLFVLLFCLICLGQSGVETRKTNPQCFHSSVCGGSRFELCFHMANDPDHPLKKSFALKSESTAPKVECVNSLVLVVEANSRPSRRLTLFAVLREGQSATLLRDTTRSTQHNTPSVSPIR